VSDSTCFWCGELESVEVLELWAEDRAFTIVTCCEESHGAWVETMREWTRQEWAAFMASSAGVEVRNVGTGAENGPGWVLDYGLELAGSAPAADKRKRSKRGEVVREVDRDQARQFVRDWHRHSPKPPAGWKWGHGVWNGGELIAVAMVGRPVSRWTQENEPGTLEVSRLCVRSDVAPCVVWNACSMLYGAAAREAKRRGFDRVQTFTIDGEESGTSLIAAGWSVDRVNKGGDWSRKDRPREGGNSAAPKARWCKLLTKRARRAAAELAKATA